MSLVPIVIGVASAYSKQPIVHLAVGAYLLSLGDDKDDVAGCTSYILFGAAYGLGYFSMQLLLNYLFPN